MDLFTRWSQHIRDNTFAREYPFAQARVPYQGMESLVQELLHEDTALWWSQDSSLPSLKYLPDPARQKENDRRLDGWVGGLIREIRQIPQSAEDREIWQRRLRPPMLDFARLALNLEQRHFDFIETTGMIEASQEFARLARQFDPHISAEDIYQAGRNVMTMNFLQLLLGLPVEVTPSVFAYSMLYPVSDNYLDDPSINRSTKLAFNHRFRERLRGEPVRPANAHEETIARLINMIEQQWDRARFPQVYDSLLAIHAAQGRSMALAAPGASPYEHDVLGISFEKGGTSVLADGYLVAGALTREQAAFCFGYGCYTQLMDDLEDLEGDLRSGSQTVFSQTAGRWPLDRILYRMIHFGHAVFDDLSAFPTPAAAGLSEIIDRSMDIVLIDIIGRAEKYCGKAALSSLEQHSPFHFAAARRQREKLNRQKVSLGKLVESLMALD